MTEKRKDELMRPISVSVSPAMVAQLQSRAQNQTPENPNVSAYVRRFIFQDLEGMVLDRKTALAIYRELESVKGFLDNLRLFDSIPARVTDQAGECGRVIGNVRDSIWRLVGMESPSPAESVSSAPAYGGVDVSKDLAGVDFDQLAQSVPSRAVGEPSAQRRGPSARPSPQSKVRRSSPKRAQG